MSEENLEVLKHWMTQERILWERTLSTILRLTIP